METNWEGYPLVQDVLKEVEKTAPKGFSITHEYPDVIGVWNEKWEDRDQFILLGDVNGHFGFNDQYGSDICGDMEGIKNAEDIAKEFWSQVSKFYPEAKESN